jgi:hypothetical protein
MAKKFVMTLLWRISQTGPILSLFFWSTALAGIFWQIVGVGSGGQKGPLYDSLIGIGIPPERVTIVGILILFLLFASFILVVGFLYDRVFRLWREQTIVTMERNPYAENLLFTKEARQWEQFYLPLARAVYRVSPDPELKEAIARVENWVASGKVEPKGRS